MEPPFTVELFIFPSGVGRLQWHFSSDSKAIALDLPARFVKVILLLQDAKDLDKNSEHIPPSLQGYRKADAIASLYDTVPPEPTTITRYLSDLCRTIARLQGVPPLIERIPYRGAKLVCQLKTTYVEPQAHPEEES